MRFSSAATTIVVAALFCSSAPGSAQQVARTRPDSAKSGARKQTITIRPVLRRYSVDTTTVAEHGASLEYAISTGRTRLRVSGSPLAFTDGTTDIRGALPAELVADVRVGHLDTIRLTLRGPSFPGSLSSTQVSALGSAGTATLDLESATIGTPAAAGLRAAIAGPAGSVILGLRFGVEVEPRPGGTNSVYWRGTTLRGGGSLTAFAGEFRITGGLEVSRSFADSLAGWNLFPGGGSFTVRADASGLVGSGATLANFSAFYFRPLNLTRPVQANRLIPTGGFSGASGSLFVPVGQCFLAPSLSVSRESSTATEIFLGQRLNVRGSGFALSGSLGVDFPLGRHLSLMPEAGFVSGTVRSDILVGGTPARPTQFLPIALFSDPVSGWWTALEFSASF